MELRSALVSQPLCPQETARCVTLSQCRFSQGFLRKTSGPASPAALSEASLYVNRRNAGKHSQATLLSWYHANLKIS